MRFEREAKPGPDRTLVGSCPGLSGFIGDKAGHVPDMSGHVRCKFAYLSSISCLVIDTYSIGSARERSLLRYGDW
jgi:hypothetical protein